MLPPLPKPAFASAFVTGGSGFLGNALIEELVSHGVRVRALARSDGAAAAVERAGAEPVRGDLSDPGPLLEGATGTEVVFHAAAFVAVWGDRGEAFEATVGGTERVLAAAEAAGAHMVHVSTEAVLVSGPPIVQADETWPLPERPLGLYPETKGEAERRVVAAAERGVKACIVRPRFIWGRGNNPLTRQIAETVERGQWAWIGGGTCLTSTCHVRNVVEGMLCAADKGTPGERYFLTDGPPVVMREFLTRVLATQGVTPPDRTLPLGVAKPLARLLEALWTVLPLKGEPPIVRTSVALVGQEVTVIDEKARRELGYRGLVTLEQGLADMAG